MKFRNYEEYKQMRDAALEEAQRLLNEGQMDAYKAKVEEVKELDTSYEEFAREQANIAALQGAVRPHMNNSGRDNVIGTVGVVVNQDDDMEYRKAFMNYVLKGAPIQTNADAVTVTSDVGTVIPTTIINKIIEKMESVGGVYAKLTKTFYKGGVSVPTASAKPVATWTTERGTSDKQKKGTGSITFTYHKLRCVVAVSIAVDTVTLAVFESTLAKNIAEAMVKAIEDAAFNGEGATQNQPEGVLKATVPEGQTINIDKGSNVTYADLCKAEGAIPEGYEAGAEWYMRKTTFFNQIQAMTDENGQPIAKVNYGTSGKPEYSILGRKVNFASQVPAFTTTVTEDTPFAIIYNFEDYLLNTNLQVTLKEYEDHDTDDQIKKAIMLVDGKPVSVESLVVLQVKNA